MSLPFDLAATAAPLGSIDRHLRSALCARLAGLRGGALRLLDCDGAHWLGEADAAPITLRVHDARFYRAAAFSGSVGAAEAYADGHWDCDDLVGLVRLLVRNRELLDAMEHGPARFGQGLLRAWHALRRNNRAGARRNIAAHYDLGNAFFALFLSADLMYSSAYFATADEPLERASTRKLERICARLQLQPGDRVLEIGSGWGGFALHAAQHHGCHVTTTTISREQYELTCARVAAAGLQDRITVRLDDFRDLDGQFDKLASIEMVEAIGAANLPAYFRCIGERLRPHGLALVQAITIEDHRYAQALRSVDFIKRHIFPGSFIPSINALLAAKTAASDLGLVYLEDFGASYAATLAAWRQCFLARHAQVREQGFDERFVRLWDFYLAYCEGGFRERSIGVAHLLMAKPGYRAGHAPAAPLEE